MSMIEEWTVSLYGAADMSEPELTRIRRKLADRIQEGVDTFLADEGLRVEVQPTLR